MTSDNEPRMYCVIDITPPDGSVKMEELVEAVEEFREKDPTAHAAILSWSKDRVDPRRPLTGGKASWETDPYGMVGFLDNLELWARRITRVVAWITLGTVLGGIGNELGHYWFDWAMPNVLGVAALFLTLMATRHTLLTSHNDKDPN